MTPTGCRSTCRRTSFSHNQSVEVWGAARPAPFASIDGFTPAKVLIQLERGGTWTTVATTGTRGGNGYFDVHVKFPASGLGAPAVELSDRLAAARR